MDPITLAELSVRRLYHRKEGDLYPLSFVMHKGHGEDAVTMLKAYGIQAHCFQKRVYAHSMYPDLVDNNVPENELSSIHFWVKNNDKEYAEKLCMYYGLLCMPEPRYNDRVYASKPNRMPPVTTKRGGGTGYGRGRPAPVGRKKIKPKSKPKAKKEPKASGWLGRMLGNN